MKVQDIIKSGSLFLIAGPCVVENKSITEEIAGYLKDTAEVHGIPLIFKASYRKANRSRFDSFTGIGDIDALEILDGIRKKFSLNVISDIHQPGEAILASKYVDMLQIPAFLCRQTDMLEAAAKTGLPVNIKKGQFISAEAMKFAAEKVKNAGNNNIVLTERGTFFGYSDLVVDFRSVPVMKNLGYPVVLDCTHSLQQPNTTEGVTGGMPGYIEMIAKAGVAAGVNGLFIETHPQPEKALSDGKNMLQLNKIGDLLEKVKKLYNAL